MEVSVASIRVDVQHGQVDEMWVKALGRKLWAVLILAVFCPLWLGASSAAVVRMIRRWASGLAMLVCVDGLVSCVTAFVKGFRHKLSRDGRPGRPQLLVEPGLPEVGGPDAGNGGRADGPPLGVAGGAGGAAAAGAMEGAAPPAVAPHDRNLASVLAA